MNAEIAVFVNGAKAIIYFSLYNLHDCTFKRHLNSYVFMFTNASSNILEILQCVHHDIFKSMFNHFFSVTLEQFI